jgi:hypothetical protein
MKRFLIILALFPLLSFGQVGQWDSTEAIIYPTSTTGKIVLAAADTIYMIDVAAADSGLSYVNCISPVKLIYDFTGDATDDTIPAANVFQNFDFDSLFYFRIKARSVNSDGTLLKHKRITEIERYTVATDRMTYFNVPFTVTPTMSIVPDDYVDSEAASLGAGNNDTILVKSGSYDEGSDFRPARPGQYFKVIGDAKIVCSGTTQGVFVNGIDSVKLDGYEFSFPNNPLYSVYINGGITMSYNSLKNCYIQDGDRYQAFLRGDGTTYIEVANNIFDATDASGTYEVIRSQDANFLYDENYVFGTGTTAIQDNYSAYDFFNIVKYNEFPPATYSTRSVYAFLVDSVVFNYNNITPNVFRYALYKSSTSNRFSKLEIKGNTYNADTVESASYGFIRQVDTGDSLLFDIDNNTITIGSVCTGINIYTKGSLDITNNKMTIYRGNNLKLRVQNNPSYILNIENNELNQQYTPDASADYNVDLDNLSDTLRWYKVEIKGNVFRNPYYYGSVGGGHTCLYMGNLKYCKVEHNYFTGAGLAGTISKGENGTTAGIETADSYFLGNVWDSCGAIVKGVRNMKFYNNYLYKECGYNSIRFYQNEDNASFEDSKYGQVFNNIIYNDVRLPLSVETSNDTLGFDSDYNIYYPNSAINFAGTNYTLSNYQTNFSRDLNSYNTDPLLNANGVPGNGSPAIGNGFNLGSSYNIGLVPNTTFPDPSTTTQKALWTIGAYITNLNRTVTSNFIIFSGNKRLKY